MWTWQEALPPGYPTPDWQSWRDPRWRRRWGDTAFRAKARELDTSLRSVIKEAGGTPVEGKVLGDGVLAVFTSARQAIECALRCNAASGPVGLQLHLGIHAGDVIREGNNVYGGAVNIAARIAGASAPGGGGAVGRPRRAGP